MRCMRFSATMFEVQSCKLNVSILHLVQTSRSTTLSIWSRGSVHLSVSSSATEILNYLRVYLRPLWKITKCVRWFENAMPYATGYCHTGKPCVQVSGWGCGKSNALSKGLCYHPNLDLAYPGRQLLSFQPPELHELSPYRLRQRTRWPVDESCLLYTSDAADE